MRPSPKDFNFIPHIVKGDKEEEFGSHCSRFRSDKHCLTHIPYEDQCTIYVRAEKRNKACHETKICKPQAIIEDKDSEIAVVKGKSIETMPDQFGDKELGGKQADHTMNVIRTETSPKIRGRLLQGMQY